MSYLFPGRVDGGEEYIRLYAMDRYGSSHMRVLLGGVGSVPSSPRTVKRKPFNE